MQPTRRMYPAVYPSSKHIPDARYTGVQMNGLKVALFRVALSRALASYPQALSLCTIQFNRK